MTMLSISTFPSRAVGALFALTFVLLGCSQPRPAGDAPAPGAAPAAPASQARVLHIVIRDEPAMLSVRLDRNGQGFPLTVPLIYSDEKGALQGMLATKAPN